MRPLNILLAEDCMITSAILSEQLRFLGHSVTVVQSGEAAVACYADAVIDLILMDLEMPGQGGIVAIRAIRAMRGVKYCPILVISSKLGFDYVRDSFMAGADDFINKPISPRNLEIRIHQMMRIVTQQQSLDALIDNVIEGVVQIDRSGVITLFNKAAELIFGYTAAEVIGMNVSVLMPAPDQENHPGFINRYFQSGKAGIIGKGGEVQGRRKNAEIFPMHLGISQVETSDGLFFVGLIRDLSEEKRLRAQVLESQAFLTDVIENSAAATFVKDELGRYRLVNKKFESLVGRSRDEILGRRDEDLPVLAALRLSDTRDEAVMREGDVIETQESMASEDDARHYISVRFPIRDSQGEISGLCGMLTDVTELKRTQDRLELLSQHDELTGLFNRRHFLTIARAAFAQFLNRREGLAVLMIDIDHFKRINDRYGHHAGDSVLKTAGHVMHAALRDNDVLGRLGGEEFGVLLRDCTREGALLVAERLRHEFSKKIFDVGATDELRCTLSIGLAFMRPDHEDIDVVIKEADQALYRAKHAGRNQVCVF